MKAGGGVRVLEGCSEALGGGHAPRGGRPRPSARRSTKDQKSGKTQELTLEYFLIFRFYRNACRVQVG